MISKKKLLNKIIKQIRLSVGYKNLSLHEPHFDKKEIENINKCIKSTFVSTTGTFISKFENIIRNITKAKYVVAVNSATSALHLSLLSIGIKTDDEVIIPNLNFIASANAIKYVNATPHIVDVEKDGLGIDFDKLDEYFKKNVLINDNKTINKKTNKTIKALILLHLFGHPANLKKAKLFCNKYKILLIEDAAEGLGSYYDDKHVGTIGKTGVLSFNGNKIVTAGCGGVVLTNDKRIYKKILSLSKVSKKNHPWKSDYAEVGYNYRMTNINASLACANIKKLKKFLNLKRKLFKIYKNKFINFKEVKILEQPTNCKSNYWLQTLFIKKSSRSLLHYLLKNLNKNKIQCRPAWKLMNEINYLKKCPSSNLSNSKKIYNQIINIPSSPQLLN